MVGERGDGVGWGGIGGLGKANGFGGGMFLVGGWGGGERGGGRGRVRGWSGVRGVAIGVCWLCSAILGVSRWSSRA